MASSDGGFRAKLKKKLGWSDRSASHQKPPSAKEEGCLPAQHAPPSTSSSDRRNADPPLLRRETVPLALVRSASFASPQEQVLSPPIRGADQAVPDQPIAETPPRGASSTATALSIDEVAPTAAASSLPAGQQFDLSYSRINSGGGDIASNNVINTYHGTVNQFSDLHARIDAVLRPHIAPASQLGVFEKEHCCPGTRLDVFERIKTWSTHQETALDGGNSLCIVGVPGSGKSTIAASVASDILQVRKSDPNIHIIHYFIRRGVDSTTIASHIFPTLAFQLSLLLPAFAERLVENLGDIPTSINHSIGEAAGTLLIDPLRNIKQRILLVLDALDELSRAEAFALALAEIISRLPNNIRLVITTRNENNILLNLGHDLVDRISLEIRTTNSILEVRHYLAFKLASEIKATFGEHPDWTSWPNDTHLDALSEKAAGLFVWAATAVSWIVTRLKRRGRAGREALIADVSKKGMENLEVLYTFILEQLLADTDDEDREYLENMKLVLGFIAVAAKPLPVSTIQRFLALDDDIFDALWFIQAARSVLVAGTAPITAETAPQMHKSFFDFLTSSSKAGKFRVEAQGQQNHTASRCFYLMKSYLRFNILNLESSFFSNHQVVNPSITERVRGLPVELLYSCEFWGHHLERSTPLDDNTSRAIDSLLRNQLLFWLEVMTAAGLLHAAGRTLAWLADYSFPSKMDFTEQLDLPPFATDAFRFFSAFRSCFEDSIPHIYLSALALAPSNSLVANTYIQMMPHPQIPPAIGKTSDWDACIGVLAGHQDFVTSVSISPDGKWIASGSSDKTIRIWDARSGACTIGPLKEHTEAIMSVAFSPDGRRFASGSADETVRVWDSHTGACVLGPLRGHENSVEAVAFSPDGHRVASGCADGTIRIWDADTGVCTNGPLQADNLIYSIYSISFSPDSRHIASSGEGCTIVVWDAASGEIVLTMDDIGNEFNWQVAFSPDGGRIASACDSDTISVWDANTGTRVLGPLQGHTSVVRCIAFSPDGRHIVSGSWDKTIRLWDAWTGACVIEPLEGHTYHVVGLTFTPDARRIISCSFDQTIRIWDAKCHPGHVNTTQSTPGHTEAVTTAAFLTDGNRIISGSEDGTIGVWDTETGASIVGPLRGHETAVRAVAVSSDLTRVVSVSGGRSIRIWNLTDGSCISSTTIPLLGSNREYDEENIPVAAAIFIPGRHDVVYASSCDSYSTRLVIWHGGQSEPLGPIEEEKSSLRSSAFSPNGDKIVTCGEAVRVWDTRTGACQSVLAFSTPRILGSQPAAFSADGEQLVVACGDHSVRVWDLSTEKCVLGPLEHHNRKGMLNIRMCLPAFSQDGSRIVSGSSDGSIMVWDAHTGRLAAGPFVDTSGINSVHFSLDGTKIVSGNDVGIIRVWKVCPPYVAEPTPPMSKPQQARKGLRTPLFNEETTIRDDGWVLGPDGQLLFWLPHQYRHQVWLPLNRLVVGRNTVRVDASRLLDGSEWLSSFSSI